MKKIVFLIAFMISANVSMAQTKVGDVTLPNTEVYLIYPRQTLIIEGNLYQPRSPKNPGAFDFKKYLAKQGSFSGLKGEKIVFIGENTFLVWTNLRHRIINGFTNAKTK